MFFTYFNSSNSQLNGLYYWRQTTDDFARIASAAEVGITATSTTSIPTNAAFYNGSYWYIRNQQNVLSRIDILYDSTTGLPNGAVSAANYTINAPSPTYPGNFTFGDIAIQPFTQQLYAATSPGQFCRIDLSNLDAPGGLPFVEIAPRGTNPGVQIGTWRDNIPLCSPKVFFSNHLHLPFSPLHTTPQPSTQRTRPFTPLPSRRVNGTAKTSPRGG